MFYVLVFAAGDEVEFERVLPLEFQGRYLRSRGWENTISVVFMAGYDRLSTGYIRRLRDLGYQVSDEHALMDVIRDRFTAISRLPPYFSFTYLRWLLLSELVGRGRAVFPHVLLDGDLLMTANPSEVFEDVIGKTFLLQGCPCFTSISDPTWYAAYEAELIRFASDVNGYGLDAERIRNSPPRRDREYCNASMFEVPFRHEQDFQQYLIAKGVLPQDATGRALGDRYFWIQNPLFPSAWGLEQDDVGSLRWSGGLLWNGERQVPFVHFQNDFGDYCARWFALHDALPLVANLSPAAQRRVAANRLFGGLVRRTSSYRRSYSRLGVYERAMTIKEGSGAPPIVDIINTRW